MPPPRRPRQAWYEATRAYGALLELMNRELLEDCGVPLVWYDVMVELARSPDHALRMSELADRVLLSRSWITRRVRQLEQAGMLERRRASEDQRGVIAALTPEGLQAFQRMEASHTASIERHFSRYLSGDDAAVISRTFATISRHARQALGPAAADEAMSTASGPVGGE